MNVVFLNDALQLFVLASDLLQVLRVQLLLGKVDKNAPTPVLLL